LSILVPEDISAFFKMLIGVDDIKQPLKKNLPVPVQSFLQSLRTSLKWVKKQARLGVIFLSGGPRSGDLKISFGHRRMPGTGEIVSGGMVKFLALENLFPNTSRRFNILYLGSNSFPEDLPQLIWLARRKKAKIVLNQNGVGYPAWAADDWQQVNHPMQLVMRQADYVFYQSEFCKLSADRFLGAGPDAWEILYNPVDTNYFRPPASHPGGLVLLSAGTTQSFYRFEAAVRTLAALCQRGVDAKLIVAGRLTWTDDHAKMLQDAHALTSGLGVSDRVELLPHYSRAQAPAIFQLAHLLLHTQANDACPMVVLEAMASGLPVVYANSGGVPELVGGEAGVGVPNLTDWERIVPPDPVSLAEAVLKVAAHLKQYSRAARARAVEKFDLQLWLARHREVFASLLP
jgi:glycosyltransferase involved in cell wall biosynthesis